MVCVIFGLVSGGIIGGFVVKYLILKYKLEFKDIKEKDILEGVVFKGFEIFKEQRLIIVFSFVEILVLIVIVLLVGIFLLYLVFKSFILLIFVWCLFVGVILRNILLFFKIYSVFDREVLVIGNVSLSLFLVYVLMSVNLLELLKFVVLLVVILSV